MSRLGPIGLTQLLTDIKTWLASKGLVATAKQVRDDPAAGSTANLVYSKMATNDFFRIQTGGAANAGYAEIATGDDYNEPIYIRQYQGEFATLKRTATILDGSGNTSFPGTVTASGFSGPLTGNVTGTANGLLTTTTIAQNGLTYTGGSVNIGTSAGQLYKGSSNDAALISAPENGTYWTDTAGNVQNLRLSWSSDGKYLHDIFVSPNNNYIWHRDVVNGTARPWRRVVEENASGLTNQTWAINIGGSSASCTGNANTATQFSANKAVTLTGDVTGTASSKAGWSVATTLANSGVTAGSYGPTADVTGNNNATISVPQITVDAKGRVTSVVNRTLTCKNNTYNVYNKTLTIQKNGTNVATFTSNSNTDVTANITVPTKVSELTNDSGFLTSHQSLSNYVTLNGNQTISGTKYFTGVQQIKQTTYEIGKTPTSSLYDYINYVDKNNVQTGWIGRVGYTNGYDTFTITCTNRFTDGAKAADGTGVSSVLEVGLSPTGVQYLNSNAKWKCSLLPMANRGSDLGSAAYQWSQLYANGGNFYYGINTGCIEMNPDGFANRADGGYIDFHYNHSTADFTSRIIEDGSGLLDINNTKIPTGQAKLYLQQTSLVKGTNPSSAVWTGIYFNDKTYNASNPNRYSCLETCINSNGTISTCLRSYNWVASNTASACIAVHYPVNGTGYTEAPTPATSDNSTKIATTAFVKAQGYLTSHQSLSNYVTLNGAQTISAVKTFTAWPRIQGTGYPALELKNTAHQVGETPANGSWAFGEVLMKDKDNYSSGLMSLYYSTDKTLYLRIQARNKFTDGVPAVGGTEVGSCIDIGVTNTASRYVFWNGYVNNNVVPLSNATNNLGDTSHKWNQVFAQEYHAYGANAFMANQGGYTFLIRNDGGSTYFLMSAQNGNEGTWTNARPLTIVNSTGVCNINGNCEGTAHGLQSSLTQYTDGVTYAEGQITVGTAAGNAYKGSSNNAALISFPENGTANSTVANVQNLRLAWASDWKYWHDIFVSPNNDYIWHRNVSGGNARGWRRVVEENVSGLTNQTWSINIGGTAANVTGTVAIANGGTGATTRLNAVKALTNENVGTGTQYFLTITQNWGKAGYCSVADAKTALGLGNYVTLADSQTISGKKYFSAAPACKNGGDSQLGATPSNNIANYLEFVDKDGAQSAYIARWHWNNGWSDLFFDVSEKFKNGAKATDGTVQHASFKIGFSPAGVPLAETNGILSTTFLSGDQDPAIKAHMSGTPRSTWNYGVSTIHSGLRNGDNLFNPIGQAYSSGNCAGLVYHHVGNNNSGNYIGIEFFGLGSSFITYRSGLTKTSGKTEYASPADLNNALWNAETTYWGTGTTNKPASGYGILLTFNREGNVHTSTSNGWLAQLGLGTDTRLYLRTKANTGGAWSAWKEFLTSHQSLSNYSTLANTIKSLSISGTTITYTKGDGTTGTLTTQDNNTDTKVSQTVTTGDSEYPILAMTTASATATETNGARFSKGARIGTRYGILISQNTYNSDCYLGSTAGERSAGGIYGRDYNNQNLFKLYGIKYSSGRTCIRCDVYNKITSGAYDPDATATNAYWRFNYDITGKYIDTDMACGSNWNPLTTNSKTLGTSSLLWKALYATNVYENGTALTSKYAQIANISADGIGTTCLLAYFPTGTNDLSLTAGTTKPGTSLYIVYWRLESTASVSADIYTDTYATLVVNKTYAETGTWKLLHSMSQGVVSKAMIGVWVRTA